MKEKKQKEFPVKIMDHVIEVLKEYKQNKNMQSVVKSFDRNVERLRKNPKTGINIPKKYRKHYEKKYKVDNLRKIDLPRYYRMIYTITEDEVEIINFILDLDDHKDYNKKFGYK